MADGEWRPAGRRRARARGATGMHMRGGMREERIWGGGDRRGFLLLRGVFFLNRTHVSFSLLKRIMHKYITAALDPDET